MKSVIGFKSGLVEQTPTGFYCDFTLASWGHALVLLYTWLVFCGIILAWHEGYIGSGLNNLSIGVIGLGLLMLLPLCFSAYLVFGRVVVILDYPTLHVENRLGPFRRHQHFDIKVIRSASVAPSWKHRSKAVYLWFRDGERNEFTESPAIIAGHVSDDALNALAFAINTSVNNAA